MNREDFPMLGKDIIYLDNGATTFKPKGVIDAITDYYSNYSANAHRGDYEISYRVDVAYEESRNIIAKFINADRNDVVFTSGTTQGLNMIATGYFKDVLEQDDEVLITLSEHASNVLPWFNLAKEKGIKVNYIELDDKLHVTLDNVKKAITEKTRVISLALITNVVGDVRPIKEIIEYAHEHDIKVVVDGAQGVSHMRVDVKDLDCDFLTFSGHKMCGPTGIGVLYGKHELLEKLKPVNLGGGMNDSFDSVDEVYYHELPTRLEAGTPNIAGAIGLGEAIKYISNIGMDKIHSYELELKRYLIDKLSTIEHIKIVNESGNSGIVAFNVDGVFAQDVAYYLNKYNICVRAGNHCAKILKHAIGVKNTIRVSLYFYNTKEELDTLVDLLRDKDRIVREMI